MSNISISYTNIAVIVSVSVRSQVWEFQFYAKCFSRFLYYFTLWSRVTDTDCRQHAERVAGPTHHVTSSPGKHVTLPLLQHHLQPPTQGQHNTNGLDVHLLRPGLVSWSCDQCTLDNPATVAVCAACGVPRPRLKRGAGWACQVRRQKQTLMEAQCYSKGVHATKQVQCHRVQGLRDSSTWGGSQEEVWVSDPLQGRTLDLSHVHLRE